MQESDFYKVKLTEQPSDKIVDKYAYMPDGSIYSGDDIRCNDKYGVFYLSPMGWRCFHSSDKDGAIYQYGRIVRNPEYTMFKMLYPCIAKIYDANENTEKPRGMLSCGVPVKRKVEITKEYSDYLVKGDKDKTYFLDCVRLNRSGLCLTRYYGKYYSLGIMTKEECDAYSNKEQLKPQNPLFGTIKTKPGRHLDWMRSYALGMMNSWPYGESIATMVNDSGKTINQGDVVMTPDATVTIKQSSLKQMQDKIASNNSEVKRLNATINDLNNKNRALYELSNRRDKVEMAKKIGSLNDKIDSSNDKIDSLLKELDLIKVKNLELDECNSKLEQQVIELFENNRKLRECNPILKNILHDLEQIKLHNQGGCTQKLCMFAEVKLDYIIQNITSILKK